METHQGGTAGWHLCHRQHSTHPPASPAHTSPFLDHQEKLRGPDIFLILKISEYGLLAMFLLIDEVRNSGIRKKDSKQ